MKILFLLALLVNITFFFWQFNSGTLHSLPDKNSADINEDKQILLLDELSKKAKEHYFKRPELHNRVPPSNDNQEQNNKTNSRESGQSETRKPEHKNQDWDSIKTNKQTDKVNKISWWKDLVVVDDYNQTINQTGRDINGYTALNIKTSSKN